MGWTADEMREVAELLAAVCEVTGTQMSSTAARLVMATLQQHQPPEVVAGLRQAAVEVRGRLTLTDIVARVEAQDGRPGPEEAWALVPKTEDEAALLTDEMAAAWGVAASLMEDGVAARMAFREAYVRQVRAARVERRPVRWFLSASVNRRVTEAVVHQGLREGKVGAAAAREWLDGEALQEAWRILGGTAEVAGELGLSLVGQRAMPERGEWAVKALEGRIGRP